MRISDLDQVIKGREDVGKLFDQDKIAPYMPAPTPEVPRTPGSQMPFTWSKGFSRSFSRTFRDGVSSLSKGFSRSFSRTF